MDYLCKDIPSLSHFTFIFGPLIEQLKKVGYDERTLAAMPYDWFAYIFRRHVRYSYACRRLPPHMLEQRDEYFSYMRACIESMRLNTGRRVALVVHSMVCRLPCAVYSR